jgi:hypothetical protein
MFTAYRIAIAVSLTNQVSSVLGLIARDFAKTELAAQGLKRELKSIALLTTTGAMLGGLGYAGLRLTESLVKPATEYAHQLNIMNMAGLSHVEIAQAVGDAWRNTSAIITTTATSNLRMLLDLRNVLGNLAEAQAALPIVSKMQAVMASSSEAGVRQVASDNFAFSLAKALDIRGAATNPARFESEAGAMAQVITAFQGRVTPQMFQSVFAYARQAKFGLSPEFAYQILPTLMLEYAQGQNSQGGGSRGVGPALAAFSRLTLQGYINKKAMPELQALGLLDAHSALRTTTSGTTAGPMTAAGLAAANPFMWVQSVLMPAIERKFGGHATQQQITQEILSITRGNQLASQIILEFALKSSNFLRDQGIIRGAMPYGQAYQQAMRNDPNFAYSALGAQWENLKTAFGTTVIPIIVPGIIALTKALNDFGRWAQEHPRIAEDLTVSFTALSGAMAIGGTVLVLSQAFKALGLILSVGGLAPAALSALGVNLGAVAVGFARMAGPLALVAGALALLGPSKSFTESQEDWLHAHGLGDKSGAGSRLGGWVDSVAEAIKRALHGTSVQMDGKEVGKIVSDHQADEMSKPPADTARVDNRVAPVWPNYSFQQP